MSDDPAPLKVGVVGVGSMGANHVRVYSELPGVELVGVADVNAEQAQEVAREYGCVAMEQADLFEAVDAVSIVVPTEYHYAVAREALEADVSVLVEKPFVASEQEGRELIDLADDRGLTLTVGHIERFNPAVTALSELVEDLEVLAIDARRLGPPLEGRQIGDSVVLDLMIHDADVLLALVDSEVDTVSAIEAEDGQYAVAQVRFENGVVCTLTASRVTQRKVRTLELTARDCLIDMDYIDQSMEIHRQARPEYTSIGAKMRFRQESVTERPLIESEEPLRRELRAFAEAVVTGSEPVVTGEDGLQALELCQRISDATGASQAVLQDSVASADD
jgi:predicted dehydrogenase